MEGTGAVFRIGAIRTIHEATRGPGGVPRVHAELAARAMDYRHEMLERTVWHTTQHVRQLASLLDECGVSPDRPLGSEDIAGLPLTERVWDET